MEFGTSSLYGPHSQTQSTPRDRPIQGMDMMKIFAQLLAQAQQQSGVAQQGDREAQGGIHRDMSGNPIDPTTHNGSLTPDAQWNAMFPSFSDRQVSEQRVFGPGGGQLTASPETRMRAAQDTQTAIAGIPGALPLVPQRNIADQSFTPPPLAPSALTPGSHETMINPAAPYPQRFQDPNFSQVTIPGKKKTPMRKGVSFGF